jgi:hypothetical protein
VTRCNSVDVSSGTTSEPGNKNSERNQRSDKGSFGSDYDRSNRTQHAECRIDPLRNSLRELQIQLVHISCEAVQNTSNRSHIKTCDRSMPNSIRESIVNLFGCTQTMLCKEDSAKTKTADTQNPQSWIYTKVESCIFACKWLSFIQSFQHPVCPFCKPKGRRCFRSSTERLDNNDHKRHHNTTSFHVSDVCITCDLSLLPFFLFHYIRKQIA